MCSFLPSFLLVLCLAVTLTRGETFDRKAFLDEFCGDKCKGPHCANRDLESGEAAVLYVSDSDSFNLAFWTEAARSLNKWLCDSLEGKRTEGEQSMLEMLFCPKEDYECMYRAFYGAVKNVNYNMNLNLLGVLVVNVTVDGGNLAQPDNIDWNEVRKDMNEVIDDAEEGEDKPAHGKFSTQTVRTHVQSRTVPMSMGYGRPSAVAGAKRFVSPNMVSTVGRAIRKGTDAAFGRVQTAIGSTSRGRVTLVPLARQNDRKWASPVSHPKYMSGLRYAVDTRDAKALDRFVTKAISNQMETAAITLPSALKNLYQSVVGKHDNMPYRTQQKKFSEDVEPYAEMHILDITRNVKTTSENSFWVYEEVCGNWYVGADPMLDELTSNSECLRSIVEYQGLSENGVINLVQSTKYHVPKNYHIGDGINPKDLEVRVDFTPAAYVVNSDLGMSTFFMLTTKIVENKDGGVNIDLWRYVHQIRKYEQLFSVGRVESIDPVAIAKSIISHPGDFIKMDALSNLLKAGVSTVSDLGSRVTKEVPKVEDLQGKPVMDIAQAVVKTIGDLPGTVSKEVGVTVNGVTSDIRNTVSGTTKDILNGIQKDTFAIDAHFTITDKDATPRTELLACEGRHTVIDDCNLEVASIQPVVYAPSPTPEAPKPERKERGNVDPFDWMD